MELKEITQICWQASQNRKACSVTMRNEPLGRVVHPYGICCTTANHIVLVCWQVLGFTKSGGKAGYRNLRLQEIEKIEVLDRSFHVQKDFNAHDTLYKDWVYHI